MLPSFLLSKTAVTRFSLSFHFILLIQFRLFYLDDDDDDDNNVYPLQLGLHLVAAFLKCHLEISHFFFLFSHIY